MRGKQNQLASRIKKVMQADDDVGRIAQATPVLIGHSVELFVQRLCKGASDLATERGDKTLSTAHLKAFVNKDAQLDFLKDIVQAAPELADKASPAKRQRSSANQRGETPVSPRGRGQGKGRGRGKQKQDPEDADSTPRKRAKTESPADVKPEANDAPLSESKVAGGGLPQEAGLAAKVPAGTELKVEFNESGLEASIKTQEDAGKGVPLFSAPAESSLQGQQAGEFLKATTGPGLSATGAASQIPDAACLPAFQTLPSSVGALEDEDDYDAE